MSPESETSNVPFDPTHSMKTKSKKSWKSIAIEIAAVSVILITLAVSLMPEVARVREPSRMQSSNNLKQIGAAMQNFDSVFGRLPPRAMCNKEGKPVLSWRVAILPYMEEEKIYNQFNLNEPWDSPTNKPLIEKMPRMYLNPKKPEQQQKGLTYCKVFAGKNTAFDEPVLKDNLWLNRWSFGELERMPRRAEGVLICAEVGEPVIWSKPEDSQYDSDSPLPGLTPIYVGGFMALMGNGRVISIDKNIKESTLRAAIDPKSDSKESVDQ
jgi:hypothetical protein